MTKVTIQAPEEITQLYGWMDRKGNFYPNPHGWIHAETADALIDDVPEVADRDFCSVVWDRDLGRNRPFDATRDRYAPVVTSGDMFNRSGWLHLDTGFYTNDYMENDGKVSEDQFFALQYIARLNPQWSRRIFHDLEVYGREFIEGMTLENWTTGGDWGSDES